MWIITAFLFGFLGSFHCAAMCGPIALALPKKETNSFLTGKLLYNFGRIIMYSILGAIMGFFGRSLSLVGFQKTISITSGVILILLAGIPLAFSHVKPFNQLFYKLANSLKLLFRKLFKSGSKLSMLAIGLANGILPCGFVYLALGASLAMGSIGGSSIYMALFGIGTVPMMMFLSISGHLINFKYQKYIRSAIPYLAMAMGVWLIFRGVYFQLHSCCSH